MLYNTLINQESSRSVNHLKLLSDIIFSFRIVVFDIEILMSDNA